MFKSQQIWWFVMLVCSVLGACYLIYQAYRTMKENPIIESPSLSRTPMWEVPYPAVTLCTYVNGFNKTGWPDDAKELPENFIEQNGTYEALSRIKNFLLERSDQNNYDILSQIFPEIEIINAEFTMSIMDLYDSLQGTITIYGPCVTFNMYQEEDILSDGVILSSFGNATDKKERLWSRDSGFNNNLPRANYTYPFRSFESPDGLLIEFNINEREQFLRFDSKILMSLHAPDEVPIFDRHSEFMFIKSGTENLIEIKSQLIVSEGIEHYEPEVRQCYYSNERHLKFYRNYTQSYCETECFANHTLLECGCVIYAAPHFSNTKLCVTHLEFECFEDEASHFLSSQFKGDDRTGRAPIENCNCLPSCTQLSYESVRTTSYEADGPTTTVHVRFKSPYIQKNVRTELHSISEFFSNCGGSLGLFLGVSIFSILELFYFCTIRLYLCCRKVSADSNV